MQRSGTWPMNTRERILETSLSLFNSFGEPNTSTNHIADEMDISPGNLYYHFRNKGDIVDLLFQGYERRMLELLSASESRDLDAEDMWLFLHLAFEIIWDYRFLYRDLDNLLGRHPLVRRQFKRIMRRKNDTALSICRGFAKAGVLRASEEEIDGLCRNIVLVTTYWMSFDNAVRLRDADPGNVLGRGVYQVMSLVAPFLDGDQRVLIQTLGRRYLV